MCLSPVLDARSKYHSEKHVSNTEFPIGKEADRGLIKDLQSPVTIFRLYFPSESLGHGKYVHGTPFLKSLVLKMRAVLLWSHYIMNTSPAQDQHQGHRTEMNARGYNTHICNTRVGI